MKHNIRKKIGIFDSGVGGLTIAHHLFFSNLDADYIYIADTANMPYGPRTESDIKQLSTRIVNFLLTQKIDLCVIACHTIAATAQEYLNQLCNPIPLIGLIETTVATALQLSQQKKIGIIGTQATIEKHVHKKKLMELDDSVKIIEKACPNLASDIEQYYQNPILLFEKTRSQIEDIFKHDLDCIILGCTHYPIIAPFIQKIGGSNIRLVTGTEYLCDIIKKNAVCHNISNRSSNIQFLVTGNPEQLAKQSSLLLNWPIANVQQLIC